MGPDQVSEVVFFAYSHYDPVMRQAALGSRPALESLIGTWCRFGLTGPVYEIVGIGETLPAGDQAMRVRVLETNEEVDYRLSDLLDDPTEV